MRFRPFPPGAFPPGSLPEGFLADVAKQNPDGIAALFLGSGCELGTEEKGAVVAALSVFDTNAVLLKKWAPKLDDGIMRGLIDREGMPKGTYYYITVLLGAVELGGGLQQFAIQTHGARIVPYMRNPSPAALAIHSEAMALFAYAEIVGKYRGTRLVPAGTHPTDALALVRDALEEATKGEEKKDVSSTELRILASFAAASAAHPKTALLDLGKLLAEAAKGDGGQLAFGAVPESECERACLEAIKAGEPRLPQIAQLLTPRLARAYAALLARKEEEKKAKAAEKAADAGKSPLLQPDPKSEADKLRTLFTAAAGRIAAIGNGIREGKIPLPAQKKAQGAPQ